MSRDSRSDFTDFVASRGKQLRHLAFGLTGDWHAADDLVQTALSKLYVAWPRVHAQGAESAYARKIILRAAIDESRRPWRRETSGLDDDRHPARPGLDPGDRHDLVVALGKLPVMQRRTVVLRHWLGLSVSETALELGISQGTVKSHTSRALEALHSAMAAGEGTHP